MGPKFSPTEGDYVCLLKEDFKLLNSSMDECAILAMGEMDYKAHIREHIKKGAFGFLKKI